MNLMPWLKNPQPLKPFYFVVGDEAFLLSEIKKSLIESMDFKEGCQDFNFEEVQAGEKLDILAHLNTLPFMAEKRLIFCFQCEKFSDKTWSQIFEFFKNPVSHLVFVCFFEKKDERKKHFKVLNKEACLLEALALKKWEVNPWLDFIFKKEEVELNKEARELFVSLVGTHLLEIQIELKKLKEHAGSNKISKEDILACGSKLKIDSVFDLTDAMGKKDVVESLRCLANLIEQSQNEFGALSLLARHIRILSRLKEGEKKRLSRAELARKASVSPYFLNNYLDQSKRWEEAQLKETLISLYETDKALKSSPLSSHLWMENFILKACS